MFPKCRGAGGEGVCDVLTLHKSTGGGGGKSSPRGGKDPLNAAQCNVELK